jgi:hypothetical protein
MMARNSLFCRYNRDPEMNGGWYFGADGGAEYILSCQTSDSWPRFTHVGPRRVQKAPFGAQVQ